MRYKFGQFFFSLLLRFTDDKFDPEQAATIGKLHSASNH